MFNYFSLPNSCSLRTYLKKCDFLLIFLVFHFIAYAASAQTHNNKPASINASDENSNSPIQGFPAGSLVLMADGKEKKIEDIQKGEYVASYDPVLEDYIVSEVKNLQASPLQVQSTASVMLILEEFSASLQTNGGLAGVNLLATPAYEVLTKNGVKQISKLTEEDILYCYDEAAHRFFSFRVYDIHFIQSTSPQTIYKLTTEERNCIINSTVVVQTTEL